MIKYSPIPMRPVATKPKTKTPTRHKTGLGQRMPANPRGLARPRRLLRRPPRCLVAFLHHNYFWSVFRAMDLAAEYLFRAIWPAFVHLNFSATLFLQFSRIFEPRFRFLATILAIDSTSIFRDTPAPSLFPRWPSSSSCMIVKRETRDCASFATFSGG